ncbi:MAG TPA: cell wall-binding repeat-containing protein [Desulfitobacteriaceae bacterium]|nr:cell wall-binding repeat-containing protein [Desulfitobacteriaceae bacterium]
MFLKLFPRIAWFCAVLIIGLLQFSVFPAVSQASSSQIYYISPTGNDLNPGSLDYPFLTISRAIKSIQPGDTLLLREGTYCEQIDFYNLNGSPSNWYILKNYPGETPVLQGNDNLGEGFIFNNCSYWQIEGIKMTAFTGAGIYLKRGSHDFDLNNLTIWGLDGPQGSTAGTEAVMGEGSAYVTVRNCEFYNIGLKYNLPKDHGIYIGYGANHWTIDSNRIHDNSGAGIQMAGYPSGSQNSLVTNNIVSSNHQWGFVVSANACGNIFQNNRLYGNTDCDVYLLQNSSGNCFSNNYWGSAAANFNVAIGDTGSTSNYFNNNIYTKPVNTIYYEPEGSFDFASWQAHSQEGQGSFLSTPLSLPLKIYNSTRLAGINRFATAATIAGEISATAVENVIIASGYNYADALSGSVLAHKLNAPILLGGPLPQDARETLSFIKNHLTENGTIYILGGPETISSAPYAASDYKVVRLFGDNRYDTNQAINEQLDVPKGTPVFIASGQGFADGLSISSIAARKGYPIILSEVSALPRQALNNLERIQPSAVYIIGGTGVISTQIEKQIAKITGLHTDQIIRIWGIDRYSTSLNIAKYFALETDTATFASGTNFPDALAGGVLAAKLNAPLILLENDSTPQKFFIEEQGFNTLYFFGGNGVISDLLRWQLAG